MPFDVATDGVATCNEIYNGQPIPQDWYEKHFAEDSTFEIGPMKLPKPALIGSMQGVCASFPDFHFIVIEPPAAQEDGTVTCVIEVAATHTGEPFAFIPEVEAIAASGTKCQNGKEKITTHFDAEGKIVKQVIEAQPDSNGLHGPAGLYQQIGGKMPPPP
eukprot:gnl/MRDRNA2_/MRDRNA2_76338_c0_seq1.p1 gnl/MRDRNA2_/MRDRNA2_76338_c0~~gnl/MRDRNA2_/MRDRNA2_76338_c0_seq1.p1  ORF type:complete len:160 (+),score=29.37 gnl/MRDRNA2_/MRDRNA2_76338_c0_seq1:131-610(+)